MWVWHGHRSPGSDANYEISTLSSQWSSRVPTGETGEPDLSPLTPCRLRAEAGDPSVTRATSTLRGTLGLCKGQKTCRDPSIRNISHQLGRSGTSCISAKMGYSVLVSGTYLHEYAALLVSMSDHPGLGFCYHACDNTSILAIQSARHNHPASRGRLGKSAGRNRARIQSNPSGFHHLGMRHRTRRRRNIATPRSTGRRLLADRGNRAVFDGVDPSTQIERRCQRSTELVTQIAGTRAQIS